jgi:hypothetical protein
VLTSALSLPVDIPWLKLCHSEDMMDATVCDRRFPLRWRSSLVVFGYQPADDQQTYEGMLISYLKIVCTITGFQPTGDEVGITSTNLDLSWTDPAIITNYADAVDHYYGCYGALVQVVVGPPDGDHVPLDEYPYFIDFEPKKRELYETVTDTGEFMSRSLENVNVRKGNTTSQSHEVLDIFGGLTLSGQGQGGSGAGGGGGIGFQGQYGSRDVNSSDYTNIRTTDQGGELRETFSHTTQLTQMYHQLASYHLGTNRALFFLLPRPHIVESEKTFVNGPRLLEGVQELFLVVMRPRAMTEFCTEAFLETAHIASVPQYEYEQSTGQLLLHVQLHADDSKSGSTGDDSMTTFTTGTETYTPPAGWEIDTDRDGGYKIESASGARIESYTVTEIARDHITVSGTVSAWFEDRQFPESDVYHDGLLDLTITVYIRNKEPKIKGYDQSLWLTGRGVCCCPNRHMAEAIRRTAEAIPDFVTFESKLRSGINVRVGGEDLVSVAKANQLTRLVGRQMMASISHRDRYPPGAIRFADTRFLADIVSPLVRRSGHPDNVPISKIPHVRRALAKKVASVAPQISRGKLLQLTVPEKAALLDITMDEAAELHRAALGVRVQAPKTEKPPKRARRARRNKRKR